MISFLQPQWLWATAAIAVPVLIHFWNVSKGRVLKIGSIAFIPASSRKSSNRLQLSELLLLMLRCLFILLISFFMAKPYLTNSSTEKKEAGWIIAGSDVYEQTISNHQALIDSLQRNGYVFRKWDTSLSVMNQKKWSEDLKNHNNEVAIKPWELVQLINKKAAKDFPVFIFSNNQLNLYHGKRPPSHAAIHWIFSQSPPRSTKYISGARLISEDSVDVVIATGTSGELNKTKDKISLTNPPSSYKIKTEADQIYLSYDDNAPVIADTAPGKMIIVDEPGKTDGKYLKAALEAIASTTGVRMEITSVTTGQSIADHADWIFWLSEQIIPEEIKAKQVLVYASGEFIENNSVLQINGDYKSTGGEVQLFRAFKDRMENNAGNMLWYDASGDAVLYRDSANASKYILRTKFNPAWTDLIWNESFPYLIYSLILKEPGQEINQKYDPRMVDTGQVKTSSAYTGKGISEFSVTESVLPRWIWWILLVTICIERIVALHSKARLQ
ncbi:BatA domain-containing protein [Pollutibacter soli]|uniref:BatA domain-containing protein n=1 Tax=Pollutibacter soli TaxID=3034157 RepID=UPI0030135E58